MEHEAHILVPTAFGPSSRAARELALAIARRSGALVTLMHVAQSSAEPRSVATGMDALGNLHATLWLSQTEASHTPVYRRASALGVAPDHLEAFRAEVPQERRESLDLRTVWRVGKVVEQIVDFVNEAGVDIIVLGAARQGKLPWWRGVRRELMGANALRGSGSGADRHSIVS